MNKPYKIICDANTPRDKWLQLRQDFVGASETSLTASTHRKKLGVAKPFPENDTLWLGNALEPVIVRMINERKGFRCKSSQTMLQSTITPSMSCTLDGVGRVPTSDKNIDKFMYFLEQQGWGSQEIHHALDDSRLAVVELKTAAFKKLHEWTDSEPPQAYWAQVQHQLYVTGFPIGWLFGLVGGRHLHVFRIERDEEFMERRAEACENFMEGVRNGRVL